MNEFDTNPFANEPESASFFDATEEQNTVDVYPQPPMMPQQTPIRTEERKVDPTYQDFLTYFSDGPKDNSQRNPHGFSENTVKPTYADTVRLDQRVLPESHLRIPEVAIAPPPPAPSPSIPIAHHAIPEQRPMPPREELSIPVTQNTLPEQRPMVPPSIPPPRYPIPEQKSMTPRETPVVNSQPEISHVQFVEQTPIISDEIELPLLEELGIDLANISSKALAVLNPFARTSNAEALADADLAGPLVLIFIIAFMQTIVGKVHYGFLYGLSILGTTAMHFLQSMLPQKQSDREQSFILTMSTLGYCLLPVTFLSITNILCTVVRTRFTLFFLHWMVSPVVVVWAAYCATKMFRPESQMGSAFGAMMYPLILLYAIFSYAVVY